MPSRYHECLGRLPGLLPLIRPRATPKPSQSPYPYRTPKSSSKHLLVLQYSPPSPFIHTTRYTMHRRYWYWLPFSIARRVRSLLQAHWRAYCQPIVRAIQGVFTSLLATLLAGLITGLLQAYSPRIQILLHICTYRIYVSVLTFAQYFCHLTSILFDRVSMTSTSLGLHCPLGWHFR